MNREKITWEFAEPDICHICGQDRATVMAKIKIRVATINLPLCELCGAKSDEELAEIISN